MLLRTVLLVFILFFSRSVIAELSVPERIKKYGSCYNHPIIVNNVDKFGGGSLDKYIAYMEDYVESPADLRAGLRQGRLQSIERVKKCKEGTEQALAEYKAKEPNSSVDSSNMSLTNESDNSKNPNHQAESSGRSEGQPVDQHGNPCITIKQLETTWSTARKEECYRTSEFGNCQDRVDNYQATNGCNQPISLSVSFNEPKWAKGANIKPGGHHKFSCSYGGRNTNNCKTYSWSAKVVR